MSNLTDKLEELRQWLKIDRLYVEGDTVMECVDEAIALSKHSDSELSDEEIERIASRQAPALGEPWSEAQKGIRLEIRANIKAALRTARDRGLLSTKGKGEQPMSLSPPSPPTPPNP